MVFAIRGQNIRIERCNRRCNELHRPGKAEERNQVGNEAMEMLVFAVSTSS